MASWHHSITASQHRGIMASQCHSITASWHHSITAPEDHGITASRCHGITSSQHHSTTASQHHSTTASQHHSIMAATVQPAGGTLSSPCRSLSAAARHVGITPRTVPAWGGLGTALGKELCSVPSLELAIGWRHRSTAAKSAPDLIPLWQILPRCHPHPLSLIPPPLASPHFASRRCTAG